MNRRTFLRTSALGATALAFGSRRTLASDPIPHSAIRNPHSRKPNLLFIMADQMRWDTLACYGNRTVKAPTLNKLASESVIYDHAIVAHPVCTPSRGCMMTGLWPHQSGVIANNIRLPQNIPCYPELLNDPDYRTAQIGKWHLGDELFAQHGFQEWIGTEDQYQAYFSAGRDPKAKSDYWKYLHAQGLKPDKGEYFSRQFACRQPYENGKPAYQAKCAVDFLRRNKNNPFVLHVSYLEPHTPFISPMKGLYDNDPLPQPESYTRRHENADQQPWRVRIRQEYYSKTSPYNGSPSRLSEINRHYYGNISVVDRSVATILAELERLGLADNTIIIFTADHGEMMSDHGLWMKEVMYQGALRVPMLVHVPGVRGGTRINAPWQHADLTPTILGLMGKPIPQNLCGRNRAPEIKGEAMPAECVFSEWSPNNGSEDGAADVVGSSGGEEGGKKSAKEKHKDPASPAALADKKAKERASKEKKEKARSPSGDPRKQPANKTASASGTEQERASRSASRVAVSPDGWKLWLSDLDVPQLFNFREDPQELHNLFTEPTKRDVVKRLTAEIHKWQERTNDTLAKVG